MEIFFGKGGILLFLVVVIMMIGGCASSPPNQYQSSTSFTSSSSGAVSYKKDVNVITQNTGPILGGGRPLLPMPCYGGGVYSGPLYGGRYVRRGWLGRGFW